MCSRWPPRPAGRSCIRHLIVLLFHFHRPVHIRPEIVHALAVPGEPVVDVPVVGRHPLAVALLMANHLCRTLTVLDRLGVLG